MRARIFAVGDRVVWDPEADELTPPEGAGTVTVCQPGGRYTVRWDGDAEVTSGTDGRYLAHGQVNENENCWVRELQGPVERFPCQGHDKDVPAEHDWVRSSDGMSEACWRDSRQWS